MTSPAKAFQARHATNLTFAFEAAVKRAFNAYTVDMTSPAPSAGSGVQTMRHIRLVPKNGRPLLIGWANPGDRTAELRTLGFTLAFSKSRLGRELAVPPHEYARFLELARAVLEERGMSVTVVAHSKDACSVDEPRPRSRSSTVPHLGVVAAPLSSTAPVSPAGVTSYVRRSSAS